MINQYQEILNIKNNLVKKTILKLLGLLLFLIFLDYTINKKITFISALLFLGLSIFRIIDIIRINYRKKWVYNSEINDNLLTLSISENSEIGTTKKIKIDNIKYINIFKSELDGEIEIMLKENQQYFFYSLNHKKINTFETLNELKEKIKIE